MEIFLFLHILYYISITMGRKKVRKNISKVLRFGRKLVTVNKKHMEDLTNMKVTDL